MQVFDADKFVGSEGRTFNLGGKTFDVSIIPARINLFLYTNQEKINKVLDPQKMDDEAFGFLLDLILMFLKRTDKTITREFIEDNLDARQMGAAFLFLIEPMLAKRGEESVSEKKSENDTAALNSEG